MTETPYTADVERDFLGQPLRHTAHTLVEWLGYLTHEEIEALKELARSLPENPVIVNIGAGGGTSGLAFLEARDDLRLITIDLRDDDNPYGGLYNEKVALLHAGRWDPRRHTQIKGDSKEIGREWAEPVDLVFVDGDHSEEGARGDIEAWLPHVAPGGIVVVHDYDKEEVYFRQHPKAARDPETLERIVKAYRGVDKAVEDLLLGKYEEVLRVDTLIAFRIPGEEPKEKAEPAKKPARTPAPPPTTGGQAKSAKKKAGD